MSTEKKVSAGLVRRTTKSAEQEEMEAFREFVGNLALGMKVNPDRSIDHPRHYNNHPSGIECITVVEHMSFNVGNAIKYLWRAGLKGALIEDLKKARWYVDREIQKMEREKQAEAKS